MIWWFQKLEIISEHNTKNQIIPQTINKSFDDIKITTSLADERNDYNHTKPDEPNELNFLNLENLEALDILKKKMFKYARDLQFEKAALVRDQIVKIEKKLEGSNDD